MPGGVSADSGSVLVWYWRRFGVLTQTQSRLPPRTRPPHFGGHVARATYCNTKHSCPEQGAVAGPGQSWVGEGGPGPGPALCFGEPPRLGDKPLVSCWRVCVELARAWRSGARARMCTTHTPHTHRQSIVLARAVSLACEHAARATNHPQHNAGPRIHDRCIPRIQVFRHVSDASRNQGTDGILNVHSFLAPSCRAPRQAPMKPRATVR